MRFICATRNALAWYRAGRSKGFESLRRIHQGTRITVADILEYLAGGMTEAQILADFPALKPEHIRACLAFAAARERRLAGDSAA